MLCFSERKTSTTTAAPYHYNGVIMSAMASQITGVLIVCLIVCSGAEKNISKPRVTGLCERNPPVHRWAVNSPHKGPVTRKIFSFDDVIMNNDVACSAHGGFRCTTWQAPKLHITESPLHTEVQWYWTDSTNPTLTHWGKIPAILQTSFSSAFSWMKMYECCLRCHWSLFLRFEITMLQYWFR